MNMIMCYKIDNYYWYILLLQLVMKIK